MFKGVWYLNLGFLLNSKGISDPGENWNLPDFQLSPQSLMPTKWNTVFTVAKQITPLFNGTFTSIYSPGSNLRILLPSLQYNLATNLDIDFVWQSFYAEQDDIFEGVTHRGFLRIKWSF
jgi:hypothetical protein